MAAQHTPGPWTTEPGHFWICNVGNNADDPGVWSAHPVADGVPFPFGDKAADARLIAAAPELLDALKALLAPHFDEDGIVMPSSAIDIVGISGQGGRVLKGSFIAVLQRAQAALTKAGARQP